MSGFKSIAIVGGISLILVFFVLGSLFADSTVSTNHSLFTKEASSKFSALPDTELWKTWVFGKDTVLVEFETVNGSIGQDASVVWKSAQFGKGGLKFTSVKDSMINYELVTDDLQFVEHGSFRLLDEDQIEWNTTIDFSKNIKAKYLSYFTDYKKSFTQYQENEISKLLDLIDEKIK